MISTARLIVVGIAMVAATCAQNTPPQPPPPNASAPGFSEQVAKVVLDQVASGLQGHNLRQFLGAFDSGAPGYQVFADQMQIAFDRYETFRMRYHLLQVSSDTPYYAMVNFDLEAAPDEASAPVRKTSEVRFKFVRVSREWHIEQFQPADFFSLP